MATMRRAGSYAANLAKIKAKAEVNSVKNVASVVAEKAAAVIPKPAAVAPKQSVPKVPAVK